MAKIYTSVTLVPFKVCTLHAHIHTFFRAHTLSHAREHTHPCDRECCCPHLTKGDGVLRISGSQSSPVFLNQGVMASKEAISWI